MLNSAVLPQLGLPTRAISGLAPLRAAAATASGGLRLLRTDTNARSLEQAQREGARPNANGDGRARHQALGHDAHHLARQESELGEAPAELAGRGSIGGGHGNYASRRAGREVGQADVSRVTIVFSGRARHDERNSI